MNGFDRCSLAIELASDFFPFEEEYLQQPRLYDNAAVRVFVHETLHFWQVLSSGFLANLALSEWHNLLEFEGSGELTPQSSILGSFVRENPEMGFSPWNLSEALARFWDLHITGPQKNLRQRLLLTDSPDLSRMGLETPTDLPGSEAQAYSSEQFDTLMLLEDTYAEPYRLSLARWGSLKSVLLFPLVGYFSLQTSMPVKVFSSVMSNSTLDRIDFSQYQDIHAGWRSIFSDIKRLCGMTALSDVGIDLTPGWDVIRRSSLNDHPVYQHYLQAISLLHALPVWGEEKIDFYFACPGDPDCRAKLVSTFSPHLTLLANGRWIGKTIWLKSFTNIMGTMNEHSSIASQNFSWLDAETLADESENIHARNKKMRQAAMIASLKARR